MTEYIGHGSSGVFFPIQHELRRRLLAVCMQPHSMRDIVKIIDDYSRPMISQQVGILCRNYLMFVAHVDDHDSRIIYYQTNRVAVSHFIHQLAEEVGL